MMIKGLYVVTHEYPHLSHLQMADYALQGGADVIQFRAKQMPNNQALEIAKKIQVLCKQYQKPFIINDDCELAMAIQADGVHLGAQDQSIDSARQQLGKRYIIGATVNTPELAQKQQWVGADYLGVGHIFPTNTKSISTPPLGLDKLKMICDSVDIPVIAIGGIHHGNAADVLRTGVSGIAVISAIGHHPDPVLATTMLQRTVEAWMARSLSPRLESNVL